MTGQWPRARPPAFFVGNYPFLADPSGGVSVIYGECAMTRINWSICNLVTRAAARRG